MQYTTNYNLRKPEDNDYYDIADQNANMDTLDSEIKQIENNALTTSSAITYTTPSSYTAPTSGSTIPTLFGRITKGLSDLFTNLAAKLDSSKIIASTNITQSGYVMDGKTCADALTQLNSNIANATETINNSYIYIVMQTLNFSAGKANYSRNLSSVFSNVRFATVMARASDHVIGCSLTNGDILNYTILMSNLSSQQFNGNIQVQIMYIGEKV